MLIIGDLRYSIKVLKITSSKDEYGSTTEIYSELVKLRAGVKYQTGTKTIDLDETFTTKVLQFNTYYRSYIEPTMRIEFNNKLYRILDISEIGFKEGLTINCELINE